MRGTPVFLLSVPRTQHGLFHELRILRTKTKKEVVLGKLLFLLCNLVRSENTKVWFIKMEKGGITKRT